MARQQQEQLTPKQQALRDLEAARASLAHHASLAVEDWHPRTMIARSIEKHRAFWIGGAVIAGVALMQLFRPGAIPNNSRDNPSRSSKNRGLFTLLFNPLIALGRQTVLDYGAHLLESILSRKISPNTSDPGTV